MSDGDHRLLVRFRQSAAMDEILRHAGHVLTTQNDAELKVSPGWLPADARALRGIPVVGVHGGIGSAIPGTKPHAS